MTLPSSGAITLAMVNVELGFASTAAISLNDTAVRTLAGKPSGAISMNDLYGKANQRPASSMSAFNLEDDLPTSGSGAVTAQCSMTFQPDGTMSYGGNGTTGSSAWTNITGGSPGANYWILVTVTSGTASNLGVTGTWQSLSTARQFGWTASALKNGTASRGASFTVKIAATSGGTALLTVSGVASATVS